MHEISRVVADVPTSLHTRAKAIAKKRCGSVSELIRDSLTKEIEFFEAKFAEEKERKTPPSKRKVSTTRSLTPLDQRPAVEVPVTATIDHLAPIFDEHARRIMEVFDKPTDLAARRQEAFLAIKRMAPLTYSNDHKITARLEALIATKAAFDAPPPSPSMVTPSLLPSKPAITNPEAFAAMLAPFAQMLQKPSEGDDPLVGRTINPRLRKREVIVDEDKEIP